MLWTTHLAPIDNVDARMAEFLRLVPQGGDDLVLSTLADPYAPIRRKAAELAAIQMSEPLSDRLLAIAAGDDDIALPDEPEHLGAICLALASESVSALARGFLLQSLKHESGEVRYHALLGLHKAAQDEDYQDVLGELLDSETDAGVIVAGSQIAAQRGWLKLSIALAQCRGRVRSEDRFQVDLSLGELSNLGASIDEDLKIEILDSIRKALKKEETMAAALKGLAAWRDADSAEAIRKSAGRWRVHPLLRVEATRSLYVLGQPDAVDEMSKHLRSRRTDVRGYAIDSIGDLQIDELFEPVAAIANSVDPLADQAVEAVAKFGKRGQSVLDTVQSTHPTAAVRNLAKQLRRTIDSEALAK